MPTIVVLGAGVSGLTTALLLAKQKENIVTVIAKHMPGDYDIEYASPWAGANVLPMADEANSRWERETWPVLKKLAAEVPEAGIHFQKSVLLRREKDANVQNTKTRRLSVSLYSEDPWFAALFDDFRDLEKHELPEDIKSGSEWTSVCINTSLYLPWLVGQCRAHGVVFKRADLRHISEAAARGHTEAKANIVINASGLLAYKLGGVMDTAVIPVRGQTVLVRNELEPMLTTSGTDDGDTDILYVMMRAAGGGTILGGTYDPGNWDANPDPNIAMRIMSRVVQAHPALKGKTVADLDVVRHCVGLRPYRTGGARIDKEIIDGTWVVHNYGHAGWGYQASYGCAHRVLELVDEILAGDGRR